MSNRYATLSPELTSIRQMMQYSDILPPTKKIIERKQKVPDLTEGPKRIEANNAFRMQFLAKQKAINLRNEIDRVQSMIREKRIPRLREPHYQEHVKRLQQDLEATEKS